MCLNVVQSGARRRLREWKSQARSDAFLTSVRLTESGNLIDLAIARIYGNKVHIRYDIHNKLHQIAHLTNNSL